jgi:hypothetical protein
LRQTHGGAYVQHQPVHQAEETTARHPHRVTLAEQQHAGRQALPLDMGRQQVTLGLRQDGKPGVAPPGCPGPDGLQGGFDKAIVQMEIGMGVCP